MLSVTVFNKIGVQDANYGIDCNSIGSHDATI
jgi:hypothetical protein